MPLYVTEFVHEFAKLHKFVLVCVLLYLMKGIQNIIKN